MKCTNVGFNLQMMERIENATQLKGDALLGWMQSAFVDISLGNANPNELLTVNRTDAPLIYEREYTFAFTNQYTEPHSVHITISAQSIHHAAYTWNDSDKPLFLLCYYHTPSKMKFYTVTRTNPYKHMDNLRSKSHRSAYETDRPLLRFIKNAGSMKDFTMSVVSLKMEDTKKTRKYLSRLRILFSSDGYNEMFVPPTALINVQQQLERKIPEGEVQRTIVAKQYTHMYKEWLKMEAHAMQMYVESKRRDTEEAEEKLEFGIRYNLPLENAIRRMHRLHDHVAQFQKDRFYHFIKLLTGKDFVEMAKENETPPKTKGVKKHAPRTQVRPFS